MQGFVMISLIFMIRGAAIKIGRETCSYPQLNLILWISVSSVDIYKVRVGRGSFTGLGSDMGRIGPVEIPSGPLLWWLM